MTGPTDNSGYENLALRRIEQEYEKLITRAFLSKSSVVEISRTIGAKRALPIYRILQRHGLIGTSLKRTKFKGPTEMRGVLRRIGISFSQWCNSLGFDVRIAEAELTGPATASASAIRQAAMRDFPGIYAKGKSSLDLAEWESEITSVTTGYSYRIDWNQRIEKYLGTIQENEEVMVIGTYPSVVLIELVRVAWLLRAIDRLGSIEHVTGVIKSQP